MLRIERPWRTQPQGATRLNAGDPLWSNLEAAYYFNAGAGTLLDSSPGRRYSAPTTSGVIAPTQLGLAWDGARSRKAASAQNYGAVGSGVPLSFAAWVTPANSNTQLDAILQVGDEVSIQYRKQAALYCNVVSAGDIYFGCNGEDYYTAGGAVSAGSPAHIAVAYHGGIMSTSTVTIWVNGVARSMTRANSGGPGQLNLYSGFPIRLAQQTTAGREFRGKIHTAHVWSRGITQGDVDRLRQTPWAGISRRIWVPQAAITGLPTLTALSPINVTTSTALQRFSRA